MLISSKRLPESDEEKEYILWTMTKRSAYELVNDPSRYFETDTRLINRLANVLNYLIVAIFVTMLMSQVITFQQFLT